MLYLIRSTYSYYGQSYGQSDLLSDLAPYFIGVTIVSIIFGFITKAIMDSKGYFYTVRWFWCGFFLGIIGIIIAICKSANYSNGSNFVENKEMSNYDRERNERRILESGGWRCVCGRVNNDYVSSCACGRAKREGDVNVQEAIAIEQKEKDSITQLKEYKELLDSGILTQEEFDAKKKQLLGL